MNRKILFQTAISLLKKSFYYAYLSIKHKNTKVSALVAPLTIHSVDFSGNTHKNIFYLSNLQSEWILKRDSTGDFSIYYLDGVKKSEFGE